MPRIFFPLAIIAVAACMILYTAPVSARVAVMPGSNGQSTTSSDIPVPASRITVTDAWVRVTPRSGALFGTLRQDGALEDRLVAAECPDAADMVEIHATSMKDGIMRMDPVDGVSLPPGLDVKLAPGGLHIMLMGLKSPKKPGDMVSCTLQFEHAGPVTVEAEVKPMSYDPSSKNSNQTVNHPHH